MPNMRLNTCVGKTEVERFYKTEDIPFGDQLVVRRYIPGYGVVVVGDFEESGRYEDVEYVSIADMYAAREPLHLVVARVFVAELASKVGLRIPVSDGPLLATERVLFFDMMRACDLEGFILSVMKWWRVELFEVDRRIQADLLSMLLPNYDIVNTSLDAKEARREAASLLMPAFEADDFSVARRNCFLRSLDYLSVQLEIRAMLMPNYHTVDEESLVKDDSTAIAVFPRLGDSVEKIDWFQWCVGFATDKNLCDRDGYNIQVGEFDVIFDYDASLESRIYLLLNEEIEKICGFKVSIDLFSYEDCVWYVYSVGNFLCVLRGKFAWRDGRYVVDYHVCIYTKRHLLAYLRRNQAFFKFEGMRIKRSRYYYVVRDKLDCCSAGFTSGYMAIDNDDDWFTFIFAGVKRMVKRSLKVMVKA